MQADVINTITTGQEIKTSKKRYIGAVFFGIILVLFIAKAFDYSLPTIISFVTHEDVQTVKINYQEGGYPLLGWLEIGLSVFLSSGLAAFFARRRGLLIGFFVSLPFSIFYLGAFVMSILYNIDTYYALSLISGQLFFFVLFLLNVVAGLGGGYLGGKLYDPELDLDLKNDKRTIFGIRWGHYFWILPLIFSPYLAGIILAIYTFIQIFIVELNFLIHPSLWFNFTWWFWFFVMGFLGFFIFLPMYLLPYGFSKFVELMQIKTKAEQEKHGNKFVRFLKIIFFGIIVPMIIWPVSYVTISMMDNLPKPKEGDFKIFLTIVGLILLISGGVWVFNFIKERIKKK